MKKSCCGRFAVAALALALVVPGAFAAGDFYYDFTQVFGGTAPASTNRPWMRATLRSLGVGQVRLTVDNLNLTGNENVDQLYFNLSPTLNFSAISYSFGPTVGFDRPRVALGEDQFKAGGDGRYDIKFSFSSGGSGANRFGAGETFYCDFSAPNLTPGDFAYLSTPVGSTPFYAAAHVQRIGANSSGWLDPVGGAQPLPVPEPSYGMVWALGGLALAALRYWRSKI